MYLKWANFLLKLCKFEDCFFAGHSGSLCDSLNFHNNRKFTTIDRDNDAAGGNCAVAYGGGHWYKGCHTVLLTGKYFGRGKSVVNAKGVTWLCHKGHKYSFKRAEMKIFVSRALYSML